MIVGRKCIRLKVLIDKCLTIKNADESFFNYMGEKATFSLARSIYPDDIERIEGAIEDLTADKPNVITVRIVGKNGQYRWMLVKLSIADPEKYGQGYIMADLQDVDEFENTIDRLSGSNYTYSEYFSLLESLMISYDIGSDRLRIFMLGSHQQMDFYNGTLNSWKENKILNDCVGQSCVDTFEELCSDLKNGTMAFEHELKLNFIDESNKKQWCLVKGKTLVDMNGKHNVIATVSTVNPVGNRPIEYSYITEARDAGTDLLNKRAITNYAKKLIASKPDYPITIAVIDIDNFKSVNDENGHMFGDEVIGNVARIVKNAVEGRGIAGRIGGDEMFIVLENMKTTEDRRSVLRTIRNNVAWLYKGDDSKMDITCSIGSATYPEDADNYDDLFKIADKMLYLAKEKGRNRYIIYHSDIHGGYIKGKGIPKTDDVIYYKYRKTDVVNGIIGNYCIFEKEDLNSVLKKISLAFGIDSIFMYENNGYGWNEHTLYGKEPESIHDCEYIDEDNYIETFREDGIKVIDNVNFVESSTPVMFNAFKEMGISQGVQIYVKCTENVVKIISFNRYVQLKKWSETDILYLSILGNVIGKKWFYDKTNKKNIGFTG